MVVLFEHVQECIEAFSNVNGEQTPIIFFENDVENQYIKLEQPTSNHEKNACFLVDH